MKPKSINSLMTYMRNEKNISIQGSSQKRKLRYMGYFYGYKGYRYCGSPSSLFPFTDFNELKAIYDFDMKLKALLYPQIMFLETAIENYALEVILEEAHSSHFADIYSKIMDDYKAYPIGSQKYA